MNKILYIAGGGILFGLGVVSSEFVKSNLDPKYIPHIKDFFISAAAIATSATAIWGLTNWRREHKGKIEFEVARDLVKATYKVRDEIWFCRAGMISPSEQPEDFNPLTRDKSERAERLRYAYSNRLDTVTDALHKLEAYGLEAETLWGSSVKDCMNELRRLVLRLSISMGTLIDNEESPLSDVQLVADARKDVSRSSKGDDELSVKIQEVITKVESITRGHLKRA